MARKGRKMETPQSAQLTRRPPPEWLTRRDVAEIFQVSPSTVTRWAREGRVPAKRTPGGHYRYPAEAVRRIAGTSEPADLVRLD